MTPNADRTQWPAEAIALAEWAQLPEHAEFHKVVDWPVKEPWEDCIDLPKLPRGQQSYRWIRVPIHTGKRSLGTARVWIFAMKWPERGCVIESGRDKRDVTLSTAADPAEAA